jgi:hypothetical protein
VKPTITTKAVARLTIRPPTPARAAHSAGPSAMAVKATPRPSEMAEARTQHRAQHDRDQLPPAAAAHVVQALGAQAYPGEHRRQAEERADQRDRMGDRVDAHQHQPADPERLPADTALGGEEQ